MRIKWWIGLKDMHGRRIHLGDRVKYNLHGERTKKEYWDPEYEIIWRPPAFTLKHVGGGKDGSTPHDFILRYGGSNGNLEVIGRK